MKTKSISLESYIEELSSNYSPLDVSKKIIKHSPNMYTKARKNHSFLRLRTPENPLSFKNQFIADFVHTARMIPLNKENQNLEVSFYFYSNVLTSMLSQNTEASKWLKENIEVVDKKYRLSNRSDKGFPRKYRIKDSGLLKTIKKYPVLSSEDFLENIPFTNEKKFIGLYKEDCIAVDAKLFTEEILKDYFNICSQSVIAKTSQQGGIFYLLKDKTLSRASNRVHTLFQIIPKAIRNKIFFSEIDVKGSQVSLTANWIIENNLMDKFPELVKLSGFKDFGYFLPMFSQFSNAFGLSTKDTKKMFIMTLNFGDPIKYFNLKKYKNTSQFKTLTKIIKEIKKYTLLRASLEPTRSEYFKEKAKVISNKKKWQGMFLFDIYSREEEKVRNILIEAIRELSIKINLPSILQIHDAVRFNFKLSDEDKQYIYQKLKPFSKISLSFK
jgi:hypothetical protein